MKTDAIGHPAPMSFGTAEPPALPASAEMFLATLGDSTLEEALANAELDAASFAWPRAVVREVGHSIRMRFARAVSS